MAQRLKVFLTGRNPGQGLKSGDSTSLSSVLVSRGVELTQSLEPETSLIICVDWEPGCKRIINRASQLGLRKLLIINEPSVVIPEHRRGDILSLFDQVLEVGRPFSSPISFWPQTWPQNLCNSSKARADRAVMVQAAKYSFVEGQLYSLRSQLVGSDTRVDLYGFGWTDSIFRNAIRLVIDFYRALKGRATIDLACIYSAAIRPISYLGTTSEKVQTMSNYKVAVVIENSKEFMSEKIFDAFFSGCIPVYVGPPLEKFGIPSQLFVRAQSDLESVSSSITQALAMDYEAWRVQLEKFLQDEKLRDKWEGSKAISRIIDLALGDFNNSASAS